MRKSHSTKERGLKRTPHFIISRVKSYEFGSVVTERGTSHACGDNSNGLLKAMRLHGKIAFIPCTSRRSQPAALQPINYHSPHGSSAMCRLQTCEHRNLPGRFLQYGSNTRLGANLHSVDPVALTLILDVQHTHTKYRTANMTDRQTPGTHTKVIGLTWTGQTLLAFPPPAPCR